MILGEGNDGASCGSEKVNDNVSADEASGKLSVGQAFGFYPSMLGMTEVKDNYVSVGVFPPEDEQGSKGRVKKEGDEGVEGEANEMEIDGNAEKTIISSSSSSSSGGGGGGGGGSFYLGVFRGVEGCRRALADVIIPQMEKVQPQLLIISAGFDGYHSDPVGGELSLSSEDYRWCTEQLVSSIDRVAGGPGQVG